MAFGVSASEGMAFGVSGSDGTAFGVTGSEETFGATALGPGAGSPSCELAADTWSAARTGSSTARWVSG
jgi:hypothetical protein